MSKNFEKKLKVENFQWSIIRMTMTRAKKNSNRKTQQNYGTFEVDLEILLREQVRAITGATRVKVLSNGDFSEEEINKMEETYGCKIKRPGS